MFLDIGFWVPYLFTWKSLPFCRIKPAAHTMLQKQLLDKETGVDSLLHFITPTKVDSIEALKETLPERYKPSEYNIVGAATFDR